MRQRMIGSRVKIDYDDQNESFASLLPVEGTIARRCTSTNGTDDWFLVDLDQPIDYQEKIGTNFQFRRVIVPQVLIRSRWQGVPIDEGETPSVFLLLVPEGRPITADPIDVASYSFVCWARATTRHAA